MSDTTSEQGITLSTKGSHDTNPFQERVVIDNLNDQEKSVMLAKAIGWEVVTDIWGVAYFVAPDDETGSNLYGPANMALAKSVCLWAYCEMPQCRDYLDKYAIAIILEDGGFGRLLDKILESIEVQDV